MTNRRFVDASLFRRLLVVLRDLPPSDEVLKLYAGLAARLCRLIKKQLEHRK